MLIRRNGKKGDYNLNQIKKVINESSKPRNDFSEIIRFIEGNKAQNNNDFLQSHSKESTKLTLSDTDSYIFNILRNIPKNFKLTTKNNSAQFDLNI